MLFLLSRARYWGVRARKCGATGICESATQLNDASIDADADANVPDAPTPQNCVEEADAKDSLPCADNQYAVFVDGTDGSTTNDGTREHPFKTVKQALGALAGKHRIYVCGSTVFAEHVEESSSSYAHLFGAFACKTWLPDDGAKPQVAPIDAGYALHVDGVVGTVRFEDISFEAIAGTTANHSSVAVFIANSKDVRFKRATLKANQAADGDKGIVGVAGTTTDVLAGNPASGFDGGAVKSCTCNTGGPSTGGHGGTLGGTVQEANGGVGTPANSNTAPPMDGVGNTQDQCNTGSAAAHVGADAPQALSAPKSLVLGSLDATGWKGSDGISGTNGAMGQGGGGGASRSIGGLGGGGSGGCGGCGGLAGTGGTAGGSSVALLSFASTIKVSLSTLTALNAGKGGSGMSGGPPSGGGTGGAGVGGACTGNSGGMGGRGGAGSGGAGGVSAAVFYRDGTPTNENSSLSNGSKGVSGPGGDATNDGPPGIEGNLIAVP